MYAIYFPRHSSYRLFPFSIVNTAAFIFHGTQGFSCPVGMHLQGSLTFPLFHSEPVYHCRILAFKAITSNLATYYTYTLVSIVKGRERWFFSYSSLSQNDHFPFNNSLPLHLWRRDSFHQLLAIASPVYLKC